MNAETLKETIRRDLPDLLRQDPAFRDVILELTRNVYADRAETQDRFYEMLAELRRDREEQARKWDEEKEADRLRWDEAKAADQRRWDEAKEADRLKWEEQARKWDEAMEADRLKWEEQARKWDEAKETDRLTWDEAMEADRRKWEANQVELERLHQELVAQSRKLERSVGALGARWGIQSEKAFRDALAGILEENFGVEVINVNEYDDSGEVFGRPDQIELDVIIKNGILLICELKSSIDKAGMYIFERKARFYERRHGRQANRLIVISPMIDARAARVAERLGIEIYGDSIEVEAL